MKPKIYKPKNKNKDEKDWLAKRRNSIGASEVAALFDCHPYVSLFELWHTKKGDYTPKPMTDQRIFWGQMLEESIAKGYLEQTEQKGFEGGKAYISHHKEIQGYHATPDWFYYNRQDELCILEVKNIDYRSFKEKFTVNGDNVEAPLYIELQLQAQMDCLGLDYATCVVLVGGNEAYTIPRKRNDEAIKQIQERVKQFWESEEEPDPSKLGDIEALLSSYKPNPEKITDLGNDINPLIEEFLTHRATRRLSKTQEKLTRLKLIHALKDAEIGVTGIYTITFRADKRGQRKFNIITRKTGENDQWEQ